ncbi:helix-turn-helix protein [Aneurinibacillus soli]|uniref:Helix-turn-helix domain protein n=1 Tax=Aneurinibacillus soli TaxID=1500254 RepID=A0A0U5B1S0_9BACL|nr:helix-turn-helix domain-containing protein [Aneurinibacillus soli]PYE64291.1 helix-turn-helix protein [Aneurinibacillus soli]BAU28240.1 Helix-turn-helix domain protein [Aneurinibacillus soli]
MSLKVLETLGFIKKNILTTSEVAELLGVTRQRINAIVKTKDLVPFKKTGETSLFLLDDVINYKENKRSGPRTSIASMAPELFDRSGSTYDSIDFFRENRHKLGQIVHAYAFFNPIDAAIHNFYVPSQHFKRGVFLNIETPHLVLVDTEGNEMWISGCNCGYGGTGPHGSQTVLQECGFPQKEIDNIFRYRVVKLFKDPDGNVDVHVANSDYDGGTFDEGTTSIYFRNDNLVLMHKPSRWSKEKNEIKTAERYQSFIPNPVRFEIYPTYEQAKEMGYVLPGLDGSDFSREEVYRVIIKDSSGRELWLNPHIHTQTPILAQADLRSLLELCGFDVPEESANKGWLSSWLSTNIRRFQPNPVIISKRKEVKIKI